MLIDVKDSFKLCLHPKIANFQIYGKESIFFLIEICYCIIISVDGNMA